MFDRFGPWTSALGDDRPTHRLDTFWKRRLTLLAATRTARVTPRRRDWLMLTLAAVAVLVMPTLHLATAQDGSASAKAATPSKIYIRASFNNLGANGKGESGLFAIDPLTGQPTKLADDFPFSVRVSPDGRTVALSRGNGPLNGLDKFAGVWMLPANGQGEKRKIRDSGGVASWSPNGKEFIISTAKTFTTNGSGVLLNENWRLNADGSGATKMTIPASEEVYDWSSDGKWIVTVSSRQEPKFPNYQLYVMHPDGTGEQLISDGTGGNVYPRFSPDGKQVAYIAWSSATDNRILIVNTDGTGRRELIRDDRTNHYDQLSWSPNGKSIVVRVETPQYDPKDGRVFYSAGLGNPRLVVINADGSGTRTIPTPAALWIESPDWR